METILYLTIVLSALQVFRVLCEHVTEWPDLVWDQKALLRKSYVQIEIQGLKRN